MSKFKQAGIDVKTEGEASTERRVVKIDTTVKPTVEAFRYPKIKKIGEGDYAEIKKKFGPLAATDPERNAKKQKDARFALNPLLRDPLSVEKEERRVIDERVKERVAALTAEAKAEGFKAGFADGYKKGHAEAFRKFESEGIQRLENLESFIAEFEGAKNEIFRANERFLVEMVFRIAKMVLLREVTGDKDYVLRLATELLERIGVKENIRIRISQAELDSINMIREGLEKKFGTLKNLNIEPSNQIQLGGCIVETEWNAIDASIETQLKGLYAELIGGGTSG